MFKNLLRRHRILVGIGAFIVLFIGWRMMFSHKPEPHYISAPAAVGDVEQTVLASATLQPFEQVDVGAQATGQVRELRVQLGDRVSKGQILAVIDPATQQNNLRNAEAGLAQERAQRLGQAANLVQAQLALARQKITLAADASSRADYEAADATMKAGQASLAALDAQIQQAEVAVDKAKVDLGYTSIVAPIDGVVIGIPVKQGQTLNAVQSAPTVVKIAKLDLMTVRAQVSEADVIKVHPGHTVYFTILGDPDYRYYGKLRSVEPAPESVTTSTTSTTSSTGSSTAAVYYDGLFDVPNPAGVLRTSMTAQVYIVLAQRRGVLTVPSAALSAPPSHGSATNTVGTVRVLDAKGRASPRRVRVGLNNNVTAEILSGLKAGERVVLGEASAKTAPAAAGPRPRGPFGPR